MLHLYLLNTRIRCFERDEYRRWQQQLIDHFFFECEKKMHVEHSISSSALRQRYLKDIFVQWRGLVLAYDEGLVKGDAILASAVWRNLFKGAPDVDPRALVAVVGWMRWGMATLESTSDKMFASEADKIFSKSVEGFWPRFENPTEARDAKKVNQIPSGAAQAAAPASAQGAKPARA
jgi:cytochrome b pre-mRNA-processing protein 3